jgi:hypothetical protein
LLGAALGAPGIAVIAGFRSTVATHHCPATP